MEQGEEIPLIFFMKLVWQSTGDTLSIDVENENLIKYWIDQLNLSNKNLFELKHSLLPDDNYLKNLSEDLKLINSILLKFRINYFPNHDIDWLDQDNLNLLHSQWVKLQHDYNVVSLLSKFRGDVLSKFHNINYLIHQIEKVAFVGYTNDSTMPWQTINPFGSEILQFGIWQIELHYQNLGRSTYEKWLNFDNNIDDTDTNNFTHIGGEVHFNICRPFSSSAPYDYINFCSEKNVKPYGNKLPIGNFQESVTVLRHTFNKNVQIENNRLSFTI